MVSDNGLLLDTSMLRRPDEELTPLYRRAFSARVKLYVSVPVYAEMQRSVRTVHGPGFSASIVDRYLKRANIEILVFT